MSVPLLLYPVCTVATAMRCTSVAVEFPGVILHVIARDSTTKKSVFDFDFSLLHSVQTSSEVHPLSYPMESREYSGQGVRLITHHAFSHSDSTI